LKESKELFEKSLNSLDKLEEDKL